MTKRNNFISKHYPRIIFVFGVIILITFYLINVFSQEFLFTKILGEDNFNEYLQVIILIIGSLVAFKLGVLARHKLKFIGILYIVIAGSLFFVTMEEISWGQRIFHVQTPALLEEMNNQKEINIHNLKAIDKFFPIGYVFLGLYGAFAHFTKPFLKSIVNPKLISSFIPSPMLFPFFFSGFFIFLYIVIGAPDPVRNWAEIAETMLYAGITIFIIENYVKFKS